MNKIIKGILHPEKIIVELGRKTSLIPDKVYLSAYFLNSLNTRLNLNNPSTFSEKIQWLKLYDRKKIYTIMVDKIAVKEYIAEILGNECIIPTIGTWEKFDDIDFSKLPSRFVLKCTHDSGGVIICKDKSIFDIENARCKINRILKRNYYLSGREWPYKNVPRKIIAEAYMEDKNSSELKDYKFYCFNGVPKYCQVIADRSTSETIDFFDMDWVHQEFTGLEKPFKPFSKLSLDAPITFEDMKKAAKKLSMGTAFLRVDFYEINGKMYFGELTFYPAAGFGYFYPSKWNSILGDMITLPKK